MVFYRFDQVLFLGNNRYLWGVRRGVSVAFALTDPRVPSSNPVAATHSLVGVCDEIL